MKGVDQPESASTLGGVRCRTRVVLTHTLTLSFSHRGDLSIHPLALLGAACQPRWPKQRHATELKGGIAGFIA